MNEKEILLVIKDMESNDTSYRTYRLYGGYATSELLSNIEDFINDSHNQVTFTKKEPELSIKSFTDYIDDNHYKVKYLIENANLRVDTTENNGLHTLFLEWIFSNDNRRFKNNTIKTFNSIEKLDEYYIDTINDLYDTITHLAQ